MMIGSEKFGGNSWPSGGKRENAGGEICISVIIVGVAIMAILCSIVIIDVDGSAKKKLYQTTIYFDGNTIKIKGLTSKILKLLRFMIAANSDYLDSLLL